MNYNKFVKFIEVKLGHKLTLVRELKNDKFSIYKDLLCNRCNYIFTADIIQVKFVDNSTIYLKGQLDDYYYRFVRQKYSDTEELSCSELIIKNIIE